MHVSRTEKYDPAQAYEVVGMVKDVRYFGLRKATEPMMYVAVWRENASGRTLVLRTGPQAAGVADAVRREVTALDAAVPVLSFRSIEQQIDNNIMEDRLLTTLSGFSACLALLISAVGLYGVVSYAVTRRTREIGIRMALGAERRSVVWLVGRHAVALVLLGAAIGIPAALAMSKAGAVVPVSA